MLRMNRPRLFLMRLLLIVPVISSLSAASCGGGGDHTPPSAQLKSINISPGNPTIALGLSQQLTATGTFSDGTTRDLSGIVTWNSSCNGIADVSASGLVSSIGQGTCTVTGTSSNISASTSITVGPPILASI